jgi:hypothetical protein
MIPSTSGRQGHSKRSVNYAMDGAIDVNVLARKPTEALGL